MKVTRLDQVRVLADPLRLRILEAFGKTPRTTKQVAELLGEKPTRLYHHVNALARVGLIVLRRTRQNRGALEKYYAAAASRFELSGDVFTPEAPAGESQAAAMARVLIDSARRELLEMFHAPKPDDCPAPPVIARSAIEGSAEELRALQARLMDLIQHVHTASRGRSKGARRAGATGRRGRTSRYTLTVLFHPTPRPPK